MRRPSSCKNCTKNIIAVGILRSPRVQSYAFTKGSRYSHRFWMLDTSPAKFIVQLGIRCQLLDLVAGKKVVQELGHTRTVVRAVLNDPLQDTARVDM